MCGILALFSKNQPVDRVAITRGLSALEHRGPDEQEIWTSANGQVALGHTRLSIIGLSNGKQPLANEDGRIHAVVNGEFYGFESIRKDLQNRGHRFQTESDSEIALHLYEEMGTACLQKLRGEFAIVLWDEKNQSMFAARDRFGIKPLYYAQVGEQIFVASEIKALLQMGVRANWDLESQFQLHAGCPALSSRTLFAGVYAIPPGHFLLAKRGEIKLMSYWDFNYPRLSDHREVPDFETAVKMVRSKLEESIRIRLRSDVPVGVYLSGGIDSCAVLGLASKFAEKPLRAFTLCFEHPDYDERKVAREMAKKAGADFCPIPITAKELADNFEQAVMAGETLLFNSHSVAKFLLSRNVRAAGYKVVLTGEGSDEVFGGYASFKKDMLLYNNQGQDQAEISKLMEELNRTNKVSQGLMLANESRNLSPAFTEALGFVPSLVTANLTVGNHFREMLNHEFISDFADRDPARVLLNDLDFERLKDREPVHQSMYLWSKVRLPQYVLTVLGDRMEMAHSIEGRVPFLDHELVETVVKLPVAYKIRGLTEKYILREAAKSVLTDTVYRRQKHPFLAPPSSLTEGDHLFQFVQDTLRGKHGFEALPFYRKDVAIKFLDGLPTKSPAERAALDPILMMMVSNAIFQKNLGLS